MRVGIMGGTLDPVHNGHIQLAGAALKMLKLDRVMLLPAGDPPHKNHPTRKYDRLQMARLAAREAEGLFACGIEVFRKGTTYTVDTLRELREKNPSTEWFYIIGQDTLEVLDTWRSFEKVAGMCTFVVIGRGDETPSLKRMKEFQKAYKAKFLSLDFNGPEISSTDIRRKVARNESLDGLVPASVQSYIFEHGLYICSCGKDEILKELKKTLKPERYQHTLGVAETAVRLAPVCGVNPWRAEIAALLHDCAKYMPLDEMRRLVKKQIDDVDNLELETVNVLHAPAGAAYAQKRFGVEDREILSAIRKHTLGDAAMSALEALIYTADFIEPGRSYFPGLDEARRLAEGDIFAAMRKCAELTNQHLESQGRQPHPRSLAMLNTKTYNSKEETQ